MSNSVTSATYIRNLSYSIRRQLSGILDPQERWKEIIISIRKPNGDFRYSQHNVRRFAGLVAQGKSPTEELLADWGTSNCTVGELVDILKSHKLLAAAAIVLPGMIQITTAMQIAFNCNAVPAEAQQPDPPSAETYSALPTRLLDNKGTQTVPSSAPTQIQLDSCDPEPTSFSSISYNDLIKITDGFNDRPVSEGGCRLGEGGFGAVYKGVLNHKLVAVKKLIPVEDMSLEDLQIQFHQEIQTLTVLQHENLVDMVGFSCDGQYPCVIYPLMPNGSLLDRLACLEGTPPLSWKQRCLIAEGTASGLEFVHRNHHVHRDVKSANILLDEKLVAKISDFGLTRASPKGTSTTMKTERIVGTCAYMAPEALRGQVTPKSDIFSFGVVLLEILSGLPPVDENHNPQFLMEVPSAIEDEDEELTFEGFLDTKMEDVQLGQAESVYTLACSCLQDRKNQRPVSKQVLLELSGVVKSISLEQQ
ncbi:interleukin-1 receptor-associated kinase 4 isoform X1 [Takifugu rubripes]|uniref:interleukin-1 receptor-associated kinase 4 isoform X1 n=1 Tax=Takifugu rubripes TaxID=31033 RepID=UPI0005D1D4CB|nr:interleukin-1 receptor-associated kinase 4 isoform X1 [Takifugu rubripes]|eukprot:XP_011605781.1 PREDICTED: interleukin-1 receptor-associated kinase 4 isoform X2 [Takifugu rubripes]